ncbi:phosphate transport system permease protein 1 [Azorhizobium caulinodans ORS 571]|uniref:Phosphate transport system permease protein 1 n=1 Tax=Azorhizobium caulinodans (strain ATCC 43989 / DSM 5975 / JCM 20966 / LMG 6465 / NBRC 14845 / NCIMB 13405 / ORS 571) TaxID=438753 RepID=A8IBQ9_AZOC5|nr:phosphate transport system permease protein 1 [Azorhizobium caulinodans ORS 571]
MSIHPPLGPEVSLPPLALSGLAPEAPASVKMEARHITYHYGRTLALNDVSVPVHRDRVTAFIGPSGCGKSTLLRVFNRMYDLYFDQTVDGEVWMDGENILAPNVDLLALRTRIGMVFQKPTPFPLSIFDNVALGVRLSLDPAPAELRNRVEEALRRAALWDEVKDILPTSALSLSGGQQQRLCIARTLAVGPEVILFDEPCSALDPIATAKIEQTIDELKRDHTIAIVTHNLQQAARISDYTAFMYLGEILEFGTTRHLFTAPADARTQRYITGRFG